VFDCRQPIPATDVYAPTTVVPSILGEPFREFLPGPYLMPDPALVDRWRPRLDPINGYRVGIVWQGNPVMEADRFRSFPATMYAHFANIPGVSLISLQKLHGLDQLDALKRVCHVYDLNGEYDAGTWADSAAIISQLDLVVTPDSAVAHLAGALGKPIWVALPNYGDWRWMIDREDTPWYPSMRLFRHDDGDWDRVFRRIAGELNRRISFTSP
jgi:hypothetical protein